MSIEATIVTALEGDAALAALIDDRIYHHRMPQGDEVPCVTYSRVGGPFHQVRNRIVASTPRFQFDVWADTTTDTLPIRDALIAALLSMWGTVGEIEIVEDADHEDLRSRLCRRRIDVRITHAGV